VTFVGTTVYVKKETIKLLEKAKRILGAKSFDEVIRKSVEAYLKIPDDLFGIDKGKIPPFTEEDRLYGELD